MKIAIINYGAGNIQSLKFAIQRLGYTAQLSADYNEIAMADKVIFPGVGEASSAMRKLKASNLNTLIPSLKQPVLGICLGMQLMCSSSEEGSTEGLGIFNIAIQRFPNTVKAPQIGWNQIHDLKSPLFNQVDENEFMYSVHSYYAPLCNETIASSNYGFLYSNALHKANFYGVQFHPEKSSRGGQQILKNFLSL